MPQIITLSNSGLVTLISDDDLPEVSQYRWNLMTANRGNQYVQGCVDGKTVLLHRFIMKAPVGSCVDHRNLDRLDNQRENLRLATRSQNMANSPRRAGNALRYKGVMLSHGKRFRARIYVDKIRINIGTYSTEEEAALAYNEAAMKYFGEFALPNTI